MEVDTIKEDMVEDTIKVMVEVTIKVETMEIKAMVIKDTLMELVEEVVMECVENVVLLVLLLFVVVAFVICSLDLHIYIHHLNYLIKCCHKRIFMEIMGYFMLGLIFREIFWKIFCSYMKER